MSRYIDADLLYKETEKKIKANNEYRMAVVDGEFLDLINDAPTEDVVEVRHGEWNKKFAYSYNWDDFYSLTCSECGANIGETSVKAEDFKYCFNCGAKMDGVRRANDE